MDKTPYEIACTAADPGSPDGDVHSPEHRVRLSRHAAARVNPRLMAFTVLNPEPFRSQPRLPLDGLAVGVKDLYDTAGLETSYGSPIYKGRVPDKDARLVQRLRELGAYVVGKTVTTEFAWRQAGPTVNPYGADRTPGGSSSGSAAAVAAGIVPLALGTQTFGSIVRPAAFCGVAGFKPSYGALPLEGAQPLSPSLDHAGYLGRSLGLIRDVHRLVVDAPSPAPEGEGAPRLRLVRGPWWQAATPAQKQVLTDAVEFLRTRSIAATEAELPEAFGRCQLLAETILCHEAAEIYRPLIDRHGDLVSDHIKDLVQKGEALSGAAYRQALSERDELAGLLANEMDGFDAILTLPALGEAPPMSEGTGNPGPCVPWTLMGVPCAALPSGQGQQGLPVGIQLVGRKGKDLELLDLGVAVETAYQMR